MKLETKTFEELSNKELYAILKLRTEIFVVEQACAYLEVDDHDQKAMHILGIIDGKIMAYSRVVVPGGIYAEPSIGRVAVHGKGRSEGYGRIIFEEALKCAIATFPNQKIKIQAQVYLEEFYKSFGFETISKPYPDVGIMHVDMLF